MHFHFINHCFSIFLFLPNVLEAEKISDHQTKTIKRISLIEMTGLTRIYCLLGVLLVEMAASKPVVGRVIDGFTAIATDQHIPCVIVSYCIEIRCLEFPIPEHPVNVKQSPEDINYFRKINLRYCVENQNCMEYLKAELQTNAYLQQQKLMQEQLEMDRMCDAFLLYSLPILFLAFLVGFVIRKRSSVIRNRASPIAKSHDDIEMAESDLVPNERETIESGKFNTR